MFLLSSQIKTAKSEAELQQLRLRSLQYLERYIYLILFNSYLHLEKKDSWRRPFSLWMHQVTAYAMHIVDQNTELTCTCCCSGIINSFWLTVKQLFDFTFKTINHLLCRCFTRHKILFFLCKTQASELLAPSPLMVGE